MGLLGRIGIDFRLLVAQAINFGLLAWFLNRFVYKPLLKGMDSSELERAEREMAKIAQDRDAFAKEQAAQRAKDKKKAAAMIAEAEKVSAALGARVKKSAQEEKKKVLAQFEERVAAQEKALAASLPASAKQEIVERLQQTWRARLKSKDVVGMQESYLKELLKAAVAIKTDRFDSGNVDCSLTGTVAPGATELRAVAAAMEKKFGSTKIDIRPMADPALVAGYRLEIAGIVIDRNLLSDIANAVKGA